MSEAPRGPQFDAQKTPAEGDLERHEKLLTMFARWDTILTARWSQWVEEAKQAYDFAAGHQWSPDERAEIEENSKIPVVFNITQPTLDAVAGAEIQNRQQVQYFPREVGDSGVADALSQGAKYVNDECNGDQEDSEAFYDTLICGIGWTCSSPEIEGDEIDLLKERVDPLEMKADGRKPNFEDGRYLKREWRMSREEFEDYKAEIGRPDVDAEGYAGIDNGKRLTVVNPQTRYTSGLIGSSAAADEVVVCEWQWWEKEPVFLAPLPSPEDENVVKVGKLRPDAFAEALKTRPDLPHTRTTQKVYYRAIACDDEILFEEELPEGCFRYKAMTGKRDRNRGTWYGLVRAMMDPQRFTNKLYSEILQIVRTNANGGLLMEEDAVADIRKFESTWAAPDKITWVKPGALSGANGEKIKPKVPAPINPALFSLMEFARDMVKACTGVNEEILGLVGREQAGVLEQQRKQAAYGILSAFFDAKRRYQRDQGRLLLAQMRVFFPDDKLMRIVDKGTAQYVTVAKTMQAQEYDIVVDEAPTGPNQKARVMATLGPLLPEMYAQGIIGAEEIADMLPYMDIPAAVADKLGAAIRKRSEGQQQGQQQQQQVEQQAQQAGFQSDLRNQEADTQLKLAGAEQKRAQAQAEPMKAQAEVETERMKAGAQVETERMKAASKVESDRMKTEADAEGIRTKAQAEADAAGIKARAGADATGLQARAGADAVSEKARGDVIGKLIKATAPQPDKGDKKDG